MPSTAAKQAPQPAKTQRLFGSPQKQTVVLSLALSAFTLLLYNAVVHNDFVNFDDDRYILINRHVRAGLTWDTFRWALASFEQANWHPVTWLSHAADYQLFGLNPAGHHYVNVILHTINVLLVFLLLLAATKHTWRSLAVAALFAVHPINVESVAWVAERKNLLCTLFFLLALGAYGYYVRKPNVKRYLAVAGLFSLGLMSKPMVVTFPFALLLLDFWPLQRVQEWDRAAWFRLVLEKLPLMALAAASAAITVAAQSAGGAVRATAESPMSLRIENALASYVRYLAQLLWPSHLAPMYPRPVDALPLWTVAGAAASLLLITWLVFKHSKRRYLAAGWFYFLGTLVPVIGIMQVGEQAMADRYAYIPCLGVFVALVWGLADWAQARRLPDSLLFAAATMSIATLAIATSTQVLYWRNSFTLWAHTLAVTENNFVAEDNLGSALVIQGKPDEAIVHFEAAARINPRDPMANLNIGAYHQEKRDFPKAIAQYQLVLTLTDDSLVRSNALRNEAMIYRLQGNYSQARELYQSALQLDPENPSCLVGLGLLAQKTGDLDKAVRYYSRAVESQPSDIDFLLLAQALERSGQTRQAQSALERGKQLSADLARTQAAVDKLLQ